MFKTEGHKDILVEGHIIKTEEHRNKSHDNERVKRRKRPSPFEKSVSSYRRERFLASKKRPLYLKIIVSTPLSIRRGGGGEAVDGLR